MSDTEVEEGEPQYEVVYTDDAERKKYHFLNRDGEATARHLNGDTYTGFYEAGKRHGHGTYTFANGCRYTGGWDRGVKHGQGSLTYPDKASYSGGWVQGKREGSGLYRYPSGDTYEGEWKNGVKSGKGVYTFAKSKEQVRGEWSNGSLMAGQWQQSGVRYIGNFKGQQPQPHGHAVIVTPTTTIAGRYTPTNTFIPITLPASPAPSALTPPLVVIPAPLTIASRALENAVLSLDHLEGVSRLRSPLPATVPNFHRIPSTPFFLTAQPSLTGLQAAVALINTEGFESIVWINARAECVVYIGDRPFVPRHPKRVTHILELPPLTVQQGEEVEDAFASRVDARIAHRGRMLAYIKETWAELREERRFIQMEEEVAGAVRSVKAAVAGLVEEEGLGVRYERVRMGEGRVGCDEVERVWEVLKGVDEGVGVMVSDWMGKENATFVGVVGLIMQKVKEAVDLTEEAGEDQQDTKEADDTKDGDDKKDEEEAEEKQPTEEDPATEASREEDATAAEDAKEAGTEEGKDQPDAADTAENKSQPEETAGQSEAEATAPTQQSETAAVPAAAASNPEVVEPSRPALTDEERLQLMRAGQYQLITRLVAALGPVGSKAKAVVDASADVASSMIHVRECVAYTWERWREEGKRVEWLQRGRQYIERYAWLILFAAWQLDTKPPDNAAEAEQESPPAPTPSLTEWLQGKADVAAALSGDVPSFEWTC